MTESSALQQYLNDGESWDADRTAGLRRSAGVAWRVAAAGWCCAVAGAAGIVALTPLKRVEPFVVRVDNTTGIVDVVPAYTGEVPDEAVSRYFLAHYLSTCERFNVATAESDYEECGAFHSARRNQEWYAQWTTTNPDSPLNVYRDGTAVRVEVTAVSFFTRASGLSDLAQVRYLKARRAGGGGGEQVTHWLATVQFGYGSPAQDPRVRRWNPLGFRVLDFRAEPELTLEKTERDVHHEP